MDDLTLSRSAADVAASHNGPVVRPINKPAETQERPQYLAPVAGLGVRALAFGADLFLWGLVFGLVLTICLVLGVKAPELPYVLAVWFSLLFPITWAVWSSSPGKLMLGLRIVDAESGSRITIGQAFMRFLGLLIPFGFLWMAVDPLKQAVHDKLGGTLVIRI